MKRIVFTCGDINGIGPEISIKTINKLHLRNKRTKFILIIPNNIFKITSELISPTFNFHLTNTYKSIDFSSSKVIIVVTNSVKHKLGKPTKESGLAAFNALKISFNMLKHNLADAIVTAPVSKTALRIAGSKYPGQTEMFADWCGIENFVMTFISKKIRVGLYSIHIPLNKVSKSLNTSELQIKLSIMISMLKNDLRIEKPKIAILGLNPHAGENGIIGDEENKIIIPALKQNQFKGIFDGPFSPDAFFANRMFEKFDLVFGFYHDQVLIPFKYINSGKGVNFSAGLSIIRTSPDHGTAYDIAGKGIADESSMIEAFKCASLIIKNRRKRTA